METTSSITPAARSTSARVTIGVGLAVAILAVVFAFNSSWYLHWYAFFRVIHVSVAVFWVGGGLMLTILGLRAERSTDPMEMATLARQAAFAGERFFAPAGLIVLLMGIAMMIHTDYGWGKFWIVAGLVGYAATFVTGVGVLLLVVADMVTKPFS